MTAESSDAREAQEQSIKARKSELFEEEAKPEPTGPRLPIEEYLKKTPATPLAKSVRIAIYVGWVLVALLFFGAIISLAVHSKRRPARRRTTHMAPDRGTWRQNLVLGERGFRSFTSLNSHSLAIGAGASSKI